MGRQSQEDDSILMKLSSAVNCCRGRMAGRCLDSLNDEAWLKDERTRYPVDSVLS